jgi:uncharacterized membrane protein YkvA (DUF1232 family)
MTTEFLDTWKQRVSELELEAYAIYLAYKDPRVLWYSKILIVCVIAYAFSPIDRFLNSIPFIGYVDHLFLVPVSVVFAFKKMIPPAVLADCREKARFALNQKKTNWVDGSAIMVIFFLFALLAIASIIWIMKDWNLVIGQWFRWFTRMALIPKSTR